MKIQLDLNRHSVENPEDKGRSTDTLLGHLTAGEIIIPAPFAQQPDVQKMLAKMFANSGSTVDEFTVGHPDNKVNPETGYPEFFWKKKKKSRPPPPAAPPAPAPPPLPEDSAPALDEGPQFNRKGRGGLRIDFGYGSEPIGLNIPV